MDTTTIAVDIAKSVFQVAVSQRLGYVCENHRLSRAKFMRYFAEHRPATVLLEACSSAHHWARELQSLGHSVILLPPHAVRPYVPRNKTDRTDAKALLEAFRNKDIHPVPIKTVDQHVMMTLHRFRSAYIAQRTARINTTRGILREIDIFIPAGAARVVPVIYDLTGDPESVVPRSLRPILNEACAEIRDLEVRIRTIEQQLENLAKDNPVIGRLRTIPGIGLLTATALVAFVGDIGRFPTGRHFASYLGLTPRERSRGLHRRLGRISKRGDAYIRMLLIHGARSVLWASKKSKNLDRLRLWALEIERSRGHNKAAVALANKLARIAWAVWRKDCRFESNRIVG
ncbi:MAG: IS110 family transposase [bacterium]|nr:MAG: IS110 family transposase [bacterium]